MKKKMNPIQIFKKLEDIEKRLEKPLTVNDYVSERDAKEMLKRGTTWFWEKRNQGLPWFRLGVEVYYKRSDLLSLFQNQ
jgi:hypothetical protein